jgi:nucleoside-diphosphate-sugar epimerase
MIDLLQKTVLVTGAGGFLGSSVVRLLSEHGASVRALLGPADTNAGVLGQVAACVTADICDEAKVVEHTQGVDIVVHMAGPPSVARSFEQAPEYVRVHTQGTAAVLAAARLAGVRQLIYISSAEVYGRPESNPVSESHRLQARSPYSAAKIGAEQLLECWWHAFSFSTTVLRPFSIYGPGASSQSLLSTILRLALTSCPVTLRDLSPVRDYCFVEDVAEAVLRCCLLERSGFEVLNIGTGAGTSVGNLARHVLNALGRERLPLLERGDQRPGATEIRELVADPSRAEALIGWRAATSIDVGIAKTVAAAFQQCGT